MHRTLLIAIAWGLLAWNVVGVVAYGLQINAGVFGVAAGIVVAAGVAFGRSLHRRAVQPATPRGDRAEA